MKITETIRNGKTISEAPRNVYHFVLLTVSIHNIAGAETGKVMHQTEGTLLHGSLACQNR